MNALEIMIDEIKEETYQQYRFDKNVFVEEMVDSYLNGREGVLEAAEYTEGLLEETLIEKGTTIEKFAHILVAQELEKVAHEALELLYYEYGERL